MGEPRAEDVTDNSGLARICWRRSGDALRRNQFYESGEKAILAFVRAPALTSPVRRPLQFEQPQFHWGKPPPAAEPRTLTRIPAHSPLTASCGQKDYSSALAYELTSQLRLISSC